MGSTEKPIRGSLPETAEETQRAQVSQVSPDDGVDVSLIRWMLGLTPRERLAAAQDMIDTVWALRQGRAT